MKFPLYHKRSGGITGVAALMAPADPVVEERIVYLLTQGYQFVLEPIYDFSVLTLEKGNHELDLVIVRESEDWDAALTRLVDSAYDHLIHEPHHSLGLHPDPNAHLQPSPFCEPASDAVLKAPFTPFDTEGRD